MYYEVTPGTEKTWPFKTGDLIKEGPFKTGDLIKEGKFIKKNDVTVQEKGDL